MPKLSGRRILVVEDEALVAMLVEDALLEAGAEIVGPAATVTEAIALIEREERLSAAVLDLNLAGEPSTPIADVLAARKIPFVVATGYGAEGLPVSHPDAPVLAKPYDPDELTNLLQRISARGD